MVYDVSSDFYETLMIVKSHGFLPLVAMTILTIIQKPLGIAVSLKRYYQNNSKQSKLL